MPGNILLEVCAGSVDGVIAAQAGGADRVEFCANMLEGGTTPSAGAIELARRHSSIELNVMIRPRGGDFLYSELEFSVMKRDIEIARNCGANGVVFGILTEDGRINRERMKQLVELARPLTVTCHRAFDMSRDPFEALEDLAALNIECVLTSGQQPTAFEGLKLLAALVEKANGRIAVMPGGGITERTVKTILTESRAREVHVYPKVICDSHMQYRNPNVSMNSELKPSEFSRTEISRERVRAFVDAIQAE